MFDSCDPMDCSLPGSSVHGILQARIVEWVAISFSRGSSQESDPGIKLGSPALKADFFTDWATEPTLISFKSYLLPFELKYYRLPRWLSGKELIQETLVRSWVGKRRKWQPTPVFLPRKPTDRGAWQAVVHRVAESDTI